MISFLGKVLLFQMLMTTPGARADAPKFLGRPAMNEIRFADYDGFQSKWKLITVRFRTDTGEQRLTFANGKAAQALAANSKDYPDGAVFAKIGMSTEDDEAFTSSKVPSGAKRYQFMVRNKKKYAGTGGWGYALFDDQGLTFDEDPAPKTMACYACHKIVPERGDVFSRPMELGKNVAPRPVLTGTSHGKLKFSDQKISALPERLHDLFANPNQDVRVLNGPLSQHLFQGTLDEIRPALIEEASRSGKAALLISQDRGQISAVVPSAQLKDKPTETCPAGKVSFKAFWTLPQPNAQGQRTLIDLMICH